MALNSQTMAEIKRKAQAGIKLTNPTSQSTAFYNQYKPASAQPALPNRSPGIFSPNTAQTVATPPAVAAGPGSYRKPIVAMPNYSPGASSVTTLPNNQPGASKITPYTSSSYGTITNQGSGVNQGLTKSIGSAGQKGTPESAQAWINDPRSGHGGIDAYTKKQQNSYQQALATGNTDLISRLESDAKRVGYSLQDLGDKSLENPAVEPPPADYSWITDQVNNELATQKAAIEQELARLKQESELAVNQNNTFLQDQMKNLEENRVTVGNEIVNYQNRRGGFYSGGLDYQTAHNNEVFTEQKGDATRDIAARNADIWGRNSLLAQQAADNLAQLQQHAPDRIRQLIEEQKAKDAAFAVQEAGVTGKYKGQLTPAGQTQILNNKGQALTNEINALKLQNLPQELKLGLQQLENDVATGALNRQEAELKLKELKDPNSVTNKAAKLELEIKQMEAKYLPQEKQLALTELRKRISQIGARAPVSATDAEMKRINLEKARISLDKLKNGEDKPKAVDNKASTDLHSDLLDDFSSSALTATADRQGVTPKNLARDILKQNRDFLSDSDYKNLNDYINAKL